MSGVVGKRAFPPTVAFVLAAAIFTGIYSSASAPSILIDVQQRAWGYPAAFLTISFAVYAGSILASLLTFGGLADFVGRRPVIIAGLLLDAVAMVFFMFANAIEWVLVARAIQGIAMGAVVGAVSSSIVDSAPSRPKTIGPLIAAFAPQAGSALGGIIAGWILGWALEPSMVIFASFGFVFVAGAVVTFWLPDPVIRRRGAFASLRPQVSLPIEARREFLASIPVFASGWMLGALYLGLVPVIVRAVLHQDNSWAGGLLIGIFSGVAGLSGMLGGFLRPRASTLAGVSIIAVGTGITVVALASSSFSLFIFSTAVAAVGFGLANAGAMRTVVPAALPHHRAELFSAIYVVCYLAFGIPIALAGIIGDLIGLDTISMTYTLVIACLAVISLVIQARTGATDAKTCAMPSGTSPRVASSAMENVTGHDR
jgi:MFS family permease